MMGSRAGRVNDAQRVLLSRPIASGEQCEPSSNGRGRSRMPARKSVDPEEMTVPDLRAIHSSLTLHAAGIKSE